MNGKCGVNNKFFWWVSGTCFGDDEMLLFDNVPVRIERNIVVISGGSGRVRVA